MLEQKITESEILFMENWFTPVAMAECLFSNGDNLSYYNEDEFLHIRFGQYPLLSYEYIIDKFPDMTEKEFFRLREGAGNMYCFAGRAWGKTFCGEKIDFNLYALCEENEEAGFSAFDENHLKKVLDIMYFVWDSHPIISLFKQRVIRNPYIFTTRTGIKITGINMKISSGSLAGESFVGEHFKKLWIEEGSKETKVVYDKREGSQSEIGCIFRVFGMTDFTKHTPAGQVFHDLDRQHEVLNLPRYVNHNFDEKSYKKAKKQYGGEENLMFKVYVGGEVIEHGDTVFDMQMIRDLLYPHKKDGSLDENRKIKHIELTKSNFKKYSSLLILSRPSNVEKIFLAADVGQKGGITEIAVFGKVDTKYRYLYNITLNHLEKPQQYSVFKKIVGLLNAEYLALDSSGGMGEALFFDMKLDTVFKNTELVWVAFQENIPVGIEIDEKTGKEVRVKGKPIFKEMNTVDWSIIRLSHLFYESLLKLPYDSRLDEQLDRVVSIVSDKTGAVLYKCLAQQDHLYQAFQVFSIMQWFYEFGLLGKKNNQNLKHCKIGA